MVSQCVTPIKGRVIRVMKLDACGSIVTGASSSMVVADGFISVKNSPQYEDGTEFIQKRADGFLCVNQKDPGQLKRVQLESLFCTVDPDLRVIMDGARLLTSGGVTGAGAVFTDALNTNRFSLEIWQNITGRGACNAAGQQQYVYWFYPNLGNPMVQDFTAENAALQWHETMESQGIGTSWGAYPTALSPNSILSGNTLQAGDHYGYFITSTPPPTAQCGAQTVS
jgi:hypothetical protein